MITLSSILFFIVGVLTWPFLEYLLHRYLGHEVVWKTEFKKQHSRHHVETHYFAPNFMKVVAAVPVSVFLVIAVGFVAGWVEGVSYTLGFVFMYCVYEWVHWSFHFKAPRTALGLRLRKHHFYHHFHNAQLNHGVTMMFWDRVFGTMADPSGATDYVVQVPRQFMLPWLLSVDGVSIDPNYTRHFEIR